MKIGVKVMDLSGDNLEINIYNENEQCKRFSVNNFTNEQINILKGLEGYDCKYHGRKFYFKIVVSKSIYIQKQEEIKNIINILHEFISQFKERLVSNNIEKDLKDYVVSLTI